MQHNVFASMLNNLNDVQQSIMQSVGPVNGAAGNHFLKASTLILEAYTEVLKGALACQTNASPGLLTPEEQSIARSRGKIPAIKAVRERTHLDLKTTKEMVEGWMQQNGVPPYPPEQEFP